MPLARIITLYPDQTTGLSKQLKSQGYTVEIVSPEDLVNRPADLEIDFEVGPAEQALDRAAELATHLNSDVAVSPGIETSAWQSTQARPAIEPTPAVKMPYRPETAETEPVQPQELHAPPGSTELAPESPVPLQQQPIAAPEIEDLPVREERFEPRETEQEQFFASSEEARSTVEEQPPKIGIPPAELPPAEIVTPHLTQDAAEREHPVQPGKEPDRRPNDLLAPALERAAKAMVAGKALAGDAWLSARYLGLEYRHRLEARRAEARAEREQKLLDLAKRKTLAEERAAELEAARLAASARLQSLLEERGAAPPRQPSGTLNGAADLNPPATFKEPVRKTAVPTGAGQNGDQPSPNFGLLRAQLVKWMGSRYTPQLEAILTGVAAAMAFFAIGLAIYAFHPRPALSNSIDRPYQGVTVKTGGATVAPQPLATVQPPAPTSPAPVKRTTKQSPRHRSSGGSDVTVRHFRPEKPTSRHISRASTDNNGADASDDVVIHHFAQQSKPASAAKTTPDGSLKRISDM